MNIFGVSLRNSDAYRLYLSMRAVSAFAFSLIITYELVYHTETVGLHPLQLVTVGVVLECMTLFFEIPTGVIADAYSRRLSILIGYTMMGAGFLVEGLVASFGMVLAAQLLWGIGFTFFSGANDAWIADEVGEERAAQAYLRGTQISQIISLAGVGAGALLANFGLQWPLVVGSICYLALVLFLSWFMTEEGYQPPQRLPDQSLSSTMFTPFREGVAIVRMQPILITILLVGVVIGLSIGGFDRLYAAHLMGNFVLPPLGPLEPVAWFSILSGVTALLSLAATEMVRRWVDVRSNKGIANLLFVLYSGMLVCTFFFALSGQFFVAFATFCISQALRNTGRPLLIIWITANTKSAARATVISMYWQCNALGQIVGSPIVGWVGTAFSVRAALTVGNLIYITVLPLLRFAAVHTPHQSALVNPGRSK